MQQKVLLLTRHLLSRDGTKIQDSILLSWLNKYKQVLEKFDLELEVWQEGNGWSKELPDLFRIQSIPDASEDLTLPAVNQAMGEHAGEAIFAVYADPLLVYPQPLPVSVALGHFIPEITFSHDRIIEGQRRQWLSALRQGLSAVDYVVTNHTFFIQWALSTFPGVHHKIVHIPDCFNSPLPDSPAANEPLNERRIRLLFACPALPQFGVSETMRAVDCLLDELDNLQFYFHGAVTKTLEDKLAAWFKERPRCFFRQTRPRFQFGDIVLFPVKRGAVPATLVQEAMSSGSAVVGSMAGALVDLIVHQYNGILIRPLDGEIHTAVTKLATDKELRERICLKARQTSLAIDPQTWEKNWRLLISELIRKRGFHV